MVVAARVWALWLVVDFVLTVPEDCVRVGSLLVATEMAVVAGALDVCGGTFRDMCARNGTIA